MSDKKRMLLFFSVMVVCCMATGFAHPVTPTLIQERGFNSYMFGVALAAMLTVSFLISPFWGKQCDYMPTRYILLVGCVGYGFSQYLFGIAMTEGAIVAARMISGIFTGATFTCFYNYTINVSNPDNRGSNLTIVATIQNVAGALGYFVGGMLGLISVKAAVFSQAAVLSGSGLLFFLICKNDTESRLKTMDKRAFVREANPFAALVSCKNFMTRMLALLFAVMALASLGMNAFDQCFNYYVRDQFGLSSAYNGIFKAVVAFVSLAANSTLCMWLMKKTDTNKTLVPILGCCALSMSAILFVNELLPFVVINVVFFAFNAVRLPMLQNIIAERGQGSDSNAIMGFYNSMNSLGGIFGALFAGLIYARGAKLPFAFGSAAFALATLVAALYYAALKKERAAAK